VQERLSEDAKAASVVDKLLADLDLESTAGKKASATTTKTKTKKASK
jgi:hypothetical protein